MEEILDIVRLNGEKIDLCLLRTDKIAIELYTKWMNDESSVMWINYNNKACTYESEEEWAKNANSDNKFTFNIVEKHGRYLIGNCDITLVDRNAYLGIFIGEQVKRHQGYGVEALQLLIKFAFNELNAHRIELKVNEENKHAINCYLNAGLIECGRLHESDYYNGSYNNVLIMELLKRDWLSKMSINKVNKVNKDERPNNSQGRDISKEDEETVIESNILYEQSKKENRKKLQNVLDIIDDANANTNSEEEEELEEIEYNSELEKKLDLIQKSSNIEPSTDNIESYEDTVEPPIDTIEPSTDTIEPSTDTITVETVDNIDGVDIKNDESINNNGSINIEEKEDITGDTTIKTDENIEDNQEEEIEPEDTEILSQEEEKEPTNITVLCNFQEYIDYLNENKQDFLTKIKTDANVEFVDINNCDLLALDPNNTYITFKRKRKYDFAKLDSIYVHSINNNISSTDFIKVNNCDINILAERLKGRYDELMKYYKLTETKSKKASVIKEELHLPNELLYIDNLDVFIQSTDDVTVIDMVNQHFSSIARLGRAFGIFTNTTNKQDAEF